MMVNIYDESGEIIGTVKYNSNLDVYNGRNYQNGGTGRHLGISKVSNGRYVLIHGSDWQGERDYAEIISDYEAFQKIMKYSPELLEEEKFKDLSIYKKELLTEVE